MKYRNNVASRFHDFRKDERELLLRENQRLRVLLKDINSQLTGDEWWFDIEVIERLRKEVTDAV